MRIVVAEDEQRAREGLRDMIRSLGDEYEIVGLAGNGRLALDLIRDKKPDVVFTDIKMPVMSGLDLISAAREQEFRTRFILVSAYAEFEYAREAMQLGCDDYILKPPMKDELLRALKNVEHILKYGSRTGQKEDSLEAKYPAAHPLVKKTLAMIETGYSGVLSQQAIAQELEISPEYLSYLFGRDIGVTFSKFIKEYRIRKAAERIRAGNADLRRLYEEVGFTDRKYFNKVFHEVLGVSAADYGKADGRQGR